MKNTSHNIELYWNIDDYTSTVVKYAHVFK